MKKLACLLFSVFCLLSSGSYAATAPTLTMGNPSAPITIDEYASLGCPHCAAFTMQTLPALKKEYIDSGKVKIIFHHFPLDKASVDAALLVGCVPPAEAWDAVNLLYFQQENWARDEHYQDKLVGYGQMLGLTDKAVKACLNNANARDAILDGRLQATKKQNITGTPTFIFNGDKARVVGFQTYDQMVAALGKL